MNTARSQKCFTTMSNVGRVRHLVNFHDGFQTHKDGSPFFDLAIFSNKRARDKFCSDLTRQGYAAR